MSAVCWAAHVVLCALQQRTAFRAITEKHAVVCSLLVYVGAVGSSHSYLQKGESLQYMTDLPMHHVMQSILPELSHLHIVTAAGIHSPIFLTVCPRCHPSVPPLPSRRALCCNIRLHHRWRSQLRHRPSNNHCQQHADIQGPVRPQGLEGCVLRYNRPEC